MLFHPLGPRPSEISGRLMLATILLFTLGTAGLFGWLILRQPRHPGERQAATIAELHDVSAALEAFKDDTGRYPTTEEGLAALVTPPLDLPAWSGPYLQTVPNDAWHRPFHYSLQMDLHSTGKDGIDGTPDDLTKDSK